MGIPVKEHEQAHQHSPYTDANRGDLNGALDAPPVLLLAGEENDESEPHIWRGID